jgi:hypothetical protein
MDEYSIETKAASIYHDKTKEYFAEVFLSYQSGSYRSAVVMLWSVAVCDLLLKLRHMVDLYNDATATAILSEVERIQLANPRSPDWELKLVDLVRERTNLLDTGEHQNLIHLQQQRHLSAHPVVNANLELHRPNRETVRAFIRNTLDGLLTKPPVYTRRVLDELLQDLAASATILNSDEGKLKAFIEGRYLSRMTRQVQLEIFKSLYRLAYRTVNAECDANRVINCKALEYIALKNAVVIPAFMGQHVEFFSRIATEGDALKNLTHFFVRLPGAFPMLDAHAQDLVRHIITVDSDARCCGWFASADLDTYYALVQDWIDSSPEPRLSTYNFKDIARASDTPEWESKVRHLANIYYCASGSFDTADSRFATAIKPFLGDYTAGDLIDLLERIERNSQTYYRGRARSEHREIKQACDQVLGAGFDYTPYAMFVESIS